MIADPLVLKVRHYLNQGTINLQKQDVFFEIKRHTRAHYIGMSSLTKCGRLMNAEYFRPNLIKKQVISEKSQRIFDLGHLIEDITLKTLIAGGAHVDGAQIEFSDFNDIVKGHNDGILDGDCILEIKSMNDQSFQNLVNLGIKTSHYTYYNQIQAYLYYAKLQSGVLVAVNKNNSEYEVQRVDFDQNQVNYILGKLKVVTTSKFHEIMPPYIETDINKCKFCQFYQICHSKNKL